MVIECIVINTKSAIIVCIRGDNVEGEYTKSNARMSFHLDGESEIEAIDGTKIRVPSQSQVVIYNIRADQLVSDIAKHVHEHNPNGGFTVFDEHGSVRCSSEDVSALSRPSDTIKDDEVAGYRRDYINTDLIIRKPDLEGISQWGFIYNGKQIGASIQDDDFLAWFKDNGTINRGDYIKATLEIYVDLDPQGIPIRGKEKYTVTKVHGKILHDFEQEQL